MSIISTVPKGAAVEGINPNLLRNWYFVGGGTGRGVFPVNSRGQTSYGPGQQPSIDGWFQTFGSGGVNVVLSQTGLSLGPVVASNHGDLRQYLHCSPLVGKTVTASILLSNGTMITGTDVVSGTVEIYLINMTYQDGYFRFYVNATNNTCRFFRNGDPIEIAAAKLELGDQQTLCHQENGVWVLNEVPDYEEELVRCQISPADSTDTYSNKTLANEQELAYVENGTTASRNYAIGEYFCWKGLLYRAKTSISSGGTFTPGTNCELKSEGGLNSLSNQIIVRRQVLTNSITTGLNTLQVEPTAIAGYKAIGVAGVQFASVDRTKINLVEFLIDEGTYITVQFNSTYDKTGVAVAAFVIYAKE